MSKISVIMPSLNVRPYIEKCLGSVVSQSFKDLEIICVDAGSTDGTLEIINEFARKDSRIKVINSDVKSYGYQMNLGIRYAKGEYIGIVETDDFIDQEMYQTLYNFIVQDDVDFVKGSYKEFVEHNGRTMVSECKRTKIKQNYLGRKIYLEKEPEARLTDLNHIWSGIYSRAFLISNNTWFNETPGASFQDTSFSILVGMLSRTCIYADMAKYYYRIDNPDSSVKSDSKINCIIDEFKYVENELNKRNVSYDYKVKNMLKQIKINIYKWNYSRLTENSAKEFSENIREELSWLLNDKDFTIQMDSKIIDSIAIMLGEKEDVPAYSKNAEKNTVDFIKRLMNKKRIVLVCAGEYADRLFFLKEYSNQDCDIEIVDNNSTKHGIMFHGHIVKSMSDIKEFYSDYSIIIANKYSADELYNQICGLVNGKIDVIVYDDLPQREDMIRIFNRI